MFCHHHLNLEETDLNITPLILVFIQGLPAYKIEGIECTSTAPITLMSRMIGRSTLDRDYPLCAHRKAQNTFLETRQRRSNSKFPFPRKKLFHAGTIYVGLDV
ncbi:MAG: hypothetical protein ACTSQI_18445 [Candidatus Helarchaeota archaeon]